MDNVKIVLGLKSMPARRTSGADDEVIITKELIEMGRSDRSKAGGWTRRQLSLIGVSWPPFAGWKDWVCGQSITAQAAADFVRLKNTNKNGKPKAPKPARAKKTGDRGIRKLRPPYPAVHPVPAYVVLKTGEACPF